MQECTPFRAAAAGQGVTVLTEKAERPRFLQTGKLQQFTLLSFAELHEGCAQPAPVHILKPVFQNPLAYLFHFQHPFQLHSS